MKKVCLWGIRLLLLFLYMLGALAMIWIICALLFGYNIAVPISGYLVIGIYACIFSATLSYRTSFRRNNIDLKLVFLLKHEFFQSAATALQNISCDFSAICPPEQAENYKKTKQNFTYRSEHACFAFAEQPEEVLCKNTAEQLEPLFLFLKEINEKMYEIEDTSRYCIALKSYADAGYRIQVLLDSHSKWTIFYIPSQETGRIEKNYFYRLKSLGDGWYVATRG